MKNYRESDYAANKYSDGIVYHFVGETTTYTLDDYLKECPGHSEADFRELKALSDDIYHQQDKDEYNQTRKNVSLYDLGETEVCNAPSPEEEIIDRHERAAEDQRRRKLAKSAMASLTELQRRRYILYHGDGLTMRQIAAMEGVGHTKVQNSLTAAENIFKKMGVQNG